MKGFGKNMKKIPKPIGLAESVVRIKIHLNVTTLPSCCWREGLSVKLLFEQLFLYNNCEIPQSGFI